MYGWRARIGLLVPSINTTMEPEMWSLVPENVSVHTARIAGGREGTPEELRGMEAAGREACERIAMVEPDVVLFSCTSGSFYEGPAWNRAFSAELEKIAGAPAVTTTGAMTAALAAAGLRKVDVVTPYVATTNERLKQYLKSEGVDVARLGTFDMLDMFDHAKIQPEDVYRKVKETVTAKSEGVFVACTQVRALEVVDILERDLGKPVYSAVQATAWQAFATLGIDPGIRDRGSLLRSLADLPPPPLAARRRSA